MKLVNDASALLASQATKRNNKAHNQNSAQQNIRRKMFCQRRLCSCAFEVLLPFSPWAFGNRPAASARSLHQGFLVPPN
jgi:hypothetical protein